MAHYGKLWMFLLMMAAAIQWPFKVTAQNFQNVDIDMVMYLSGVQVGEIDLSLAFADEMALSEVQLKSTGMARFMTGYKGRAEATTSLPPGVAPRPVSFDSTYETKRHDRKIQIRYNESGDDVEELLTWKRGKPKKSNVPETLRGDTIDPLTAILRIRHWVLELRHDPAAAKAQLLHIFDGRRLYDLNAELLGRVQANDDGKKVDAFRMKIRLAPKAGFSSNDMLANWASEDGERWIELVITDDGNPVPLSVRTVGGLLQSSVHLEKMCTGKDVCRKFES